MLTIQSVRQSLDFSFQRNGEEVFQADLFNVYNKWLEVAAKSNTSTEAYENFAAYMRGRYDNDFSPKDACILSEAATDEITRLKKTHIISDDSPSSASPSPT